MALTRIENNQISNAISGNTEVGINGNLKLQEYSVTGSRLANNLNYGSNLTVTGNTTSGNVLTGGAVSATGSMTAGNIFTAGEISATGNITTNGYFLGNIACATGYNSNTIYNGTSNVLIATANGNITMSVDGTPNVVVVTSTTLQTNNISTSGNAIIGGDLVVNGNLTYVNVTDLNVEDPIIGLGRGPNNAPLTTDDGKDRGEQLWYYAGSEKSAFTGYDNSAGKILLATDVTITNEIVSVNNYGNLVIGNLEGSSSSVTGNATAGNVLTSGIISATGTATAGNVATGGTVTATGNIQGGNILTGGVVSATGNISGNFYSGNGRQLTGQGMSYRITAANNLSYLVNGGYANTTINLTRGQMYNFEIQAINHPLWIKTDPVTGTGNAYTAGVTNNGAGVGTVGFQVPFDAPSTLYYVCQFHVGMYGMLNITDGTAIQNGNSNVQVYGNGNVATSIGGTSNIMVVTSTGVNVTGAVSVTGDITGGNLLTGGTVSSVGNITGGNIATTGLLSGGNIDTTGAVSAAGSITGGNILTGGVVSSVGNIIANVGSFFIGNGSQLSGVTATSVDAGNLTGNTLSSNVIFSSLTTVGTLSNLSVSGNTVSGNLSTGGTVSATGTVIGGNITTPGGVSATGEILGGSVSASGNITGGNIDTTGLLSGGNITSGGTVSAVANITGGNILTGGAVSATGTLTSGNVNTAGDVSATGSLTGGNIFTGGVVSAVSTITGGNLATAGTITATGTATVGNLATGGTVSASGDITGGNILTAGTVSATGTATVGNLATGGTVSASGDITGGNIATAGTVSATGTATLGNVFTGGQVSATGTGTFGNINTAGAISATGNITADYFFGNGSQLTGIDTNLIKNGNSNVRILTANGNISMDVNGTSNVVVVTDTGIDVAGTASASGNITGQNLFTAGDVSATGDVYANNVRTSNVISTGALNITSGANGNINIQPNGSGNIILSNTFINSVAYPVQDQDAASKIYVDNMVSTAISYHEAVFVATTTNLATATGGTIAYVEVNGAGNGIGAKLTTTGSFNLIDSGNVQTIGTRILVKNEANAAFNGIYGWANSTSIVRTPDADTYGAGNAFALGLNDYFFVTNGNVNLGSAWIVDGPTGNITFGTSNIEFAQFSQSQIYSANTNAGLTLIGQQFNAKVDNNTTAFDGGGNIIVKAGANLTTPNIGAATGTSLSVTGNITGGNVFTGGVVSATGNITGNYFIGNGSQLTGVTAVSVDAGNLTGNTLSSNVIFSSLQSVGTLANLSVTGNTTTNVLDATGLITATGNITGGNLLTAGIVSATGTATAGNVLTGGVVSATGTGTFGNVLTGGVISATGTITSANTITGGNLATGGTVSAAGTATVGNLLTAGTVSATGTVQAGNVLTAGEVSAGGTLTGGNIFTGGVVSAVSTVTGGNLATAGTITATGNITGGNVTTAGQVSATGDVHGGNLLTSGTVSATGNITTTANVSAGNVLFGSGIVSGTGNIYADNIFANITGNIDAAGSNTEVQFNSNGVLGASAGFTFNTVGNVLTANGNVNGGNFFTTGIVSATGNVTGNYFIGNGSQLTGIDTTLISNGNSNVQVYANGNVAVSIAGSANTVVFTSSGVSAVGNVSGNIILGTTAVFGSSFAPTTGATVTINATDSVKLPTGNTAQRPTGVTGMLRYNNQIPQLEVYNGSTWVSAGGEFTVIGDDQFSGDGSTLVFTLSSSQTTNSCIVSINGVVQIPGTAYSVSGTTLTFTEAPQPGDDIDVRTITTTMSVTGISNSPANASISVSDTSNIIAIVGQLQGQGNVLTVQGDLDVTGNVNITGNIATNQINNGTSAVQIPTASGNVNIDVGAVDNMTVFTSTGAFITGNLSVTGNVTAQDVNSLSDVTLKTNIQPISGIESVLFGLNGYEYDWKNGSGHSYGFLAQEVEKVLPNAVKTGADGLKAINYMMIIPFLVETIKQMGTEINDLKKTVSSRGKKK